MNMAEVKRFNDGFGNCIFMNRNPKHVENTIMNKINEFQFMGGVPTAIKVTPIDDLHDKLSLSFEDGNSVEGKLSWRLASTGTHYVLNGLEASE